MPYVRLAFSPRYIVYTLSLLGTLAAVLALARSSGPEPVWVLFLFLCGTLAVIGTRDVVQTKHAILRNYPIAAHLRFLFEDVRPEMRQYFFEGDKDGTPFSRDRRSVVYQRAKMVLDTVPFGTKYNVYEEGYEWLRHSMAPRPKVLEPFRVMIGGPDCGLPYSSSVYNISAMSFGALSANAIRALNKGA